MHTSGARFVVGLTVRLASGTRAEMSFPSTPVATSWTWALRVLVRSDSTEPTKLSGTDTCGEDSDMVVAPSGCCAKATSYLYLGEWLQQLNTGLPQSL